jgi:uncharacterized protein (TIGR00369 family)
MVNLAPSQSSIDMERRKFLVDCHNITPICRTFGMTLHYNERDEPIVDLPHNPNLDQGFGAIHGGIISALVDHVGWFVVAQYVPCLVNTVEMHVRFLETYAREDLRAVGRLIRPGKKIFVFEAEVFTHLQKRIVIGSGTYIVTSIPVTSQDIQTAIERLAIKGKIGTG